MWDEDLPKETVSLADLEEEERAAEKATETPVYNSEKTEYEEKSHINDEEKPQTKRNFEQSEDWEEITEEPEESPGIQNWMRVFLLIHWLLLPVPSMYRRRRSR